MIDWLTVVSVLVAIGIYKAIVLAGIAFDLIIKIHKNARVKSGDTGCDHTPETMNGIVKCYPTSPVKYKCTKCGEYYNDPTTN